MPDERKCPCAAMLQAQKELREHNERLFAADTRFEVMQVKLDTIAADTAEIKTDLKELKEKPGRRWEGVTAKIIDWAVVALLAYVALQVGLQ